MKSKVFFCFFIIITNSISCTPHCTFCIINIRVHLKSLPPIFILAEGTKQHCIIIKS